MPEGFTVHPKLAALLEQPPPTAEQTSVIEAPLAPMLVVAGAGSGKTELGRILARLDARDGPAP